MSGTIESKLYRTLHEALPPSGIGRYPTETFLSHLCQEVRQIIADELTRNQPERARHDGPVSEQDRRFWDQANGFDMGWDAARAAVLMPFPILTD